MCQGSDSDEVEEQLYKHYTEIYIEYLQTRVLPSIELKTDAALLEEIKKRWENQLIMMKHTESVFEYLNR